MAHSEVMDPYKTIVDRYDGTVYSNMIVVMLDGVTSYNSYISHTPPFKWIIHPNWYTTAALIASLRPERLDRDRPTLNPTEFAQLRRDRSGVRPT